MVVDISDNGSRLSIIDNTAKVSKHAVVGSRGEWRGKPTKYPAVIEAQAVIREFARVHAGCIRETIVGEGTLIMSGAHVGHGAQLGSECDIAPNAVIGGEVKIGHGVKIGMNACINPFVTIADDVRIGSGSVVNRDIDVPGSTWVGVPARRIR